MKIKKLNELYEDSIEDSSAYNTEMDEFEVSDMYYKYIMDAINDTADDNQFPSLNENDYSDALVNFADFLAGKTIQKSTEFSYGESLKKK